MTTGKPDIPKGYFMSVDGTIKPKPKRVRKRRSDTKYKEEYAQELLSGCRYKKHLSKEHLCHKWRISVSTYNNWVERYPEFKEAHEIGKADYAAYLYDRMHANLDGTEKGSAAVVNFAMTNILGWSTKSQVEIRKEEPIMAININIIEPPRNLALEQQGCNILEGEFITTDNVVSIKGE